MYTPPEEIVKRALICRYVTVDSAVPHDFSAGVRPI
jgi:hypothetical protein